MPQPPFNFSEVRAGKGLRISSNLQITKEIVINKIVLGTKIKLIHVPTTSSSVNWDGSLPYTFSNLVPRYTPTTVQIEIASKRIVGFSKPGSKYIIIATKLPKVPDAYFIYPLKNAEPIIFSIRVNFTGE